MTFYVKYNFLQIDCTYDGNNHVKNCKLMIRKIKYFIKRVINKRDFKVSR